MDSDSEPPGNILMTLSYLLVIVDFNLLFSLVLFVLLLIGSALMSGSEIAFFSLTHDQLKMLENENSENSQKIIELRKKPVNLLATILVGNNLFNISLVLVSDFILRKMVGDNTFLFWASELKQLDILRNLEIPFLSQALSFILSVIGVTFILVLFGEVMPKIYANFNNMRLARVMASPMKILLIVFGGISGILVSLSDTIERKLEKKRKNLTLTDKEDIEDALDITLDKNEQELDILKSILNFNDVSVKQIMKPRTDVVALDSSGNYNQVLAVVKDSGYSRIPVYDEDFDNIIGILFAKDLISYTDEENNFDWLNLIRKHIYYVPESKKINEILKEFQRQKIHMAVVVDEYGGSSGIVTMEDIMEEILGDILDEFDHEEEELDYIKVDDNTYIFEGKTSLLDFVKIFDESINLFDDIKGESDSLAGTILETAGEIPEPGYEIQLNAFTFIVEQVSSRRIEKIKVLIDENKK
jgi:putative hemolysin